jgi:hypothetical protein
VTFHQANTPEIDLGPLIVTGTTSNPAFGTGSVSNHLYVTRTGRSLYCRTALKWNVAGSAGSGDYLWSNSTLALFTINSATATYFTTIGTGQTNFLNNVGQSYWGTQAPSSGQGPVVVMGSTSVRFFSVPDNQFVGSAIRNFTTANQSFSATFTLPILELQA